MLSIYRRYETGSDRTEKVLKLSTPVWPMICSVKGIQRRMLVNQRARNPWSIEIKRDLPEQVFQHMRDAIKGSSTAFGVSIQTHELKFINRNRLLRDLSILCGMPSIIIIIIIIIIYIYSAHIPFIICSYAHNSLIYSI